MAIDQKEAIKILIQLVQLAQKRGAYNLDEAYLAFTVLSGIVEDPKFEELKTFVKSLEQGQVNQGAPLGQK